MARRSLCLAVVVLAAASSSAEPCDDKCGCGVHGCDHLKQEAACNSVEHKYYAGSSCGQNSLPDSCAGKQPDFADAILLAQCETALGPAVATTIGTAVMSWLAWVPLLWRLVPQGTE
jgi:hypothetical protein